MNTEFKRVMSYRVMLIILGFILLSAIPDAFLRAQEKEKKADNLPEDIYLMPFSHFDLAWTGRTPECLSRGYRIFSEAIKISESDPKFRYFVDNMFYLDRYISSHPEKLIPLKELVKRGQIELNPLWIINFQDDNDGELSVRNLLYTKKFIKDNFEVEPAAVSMTDLPDWTPQFPQILDKSGIKFLIMTRNGPNRNRLFRWRSPDGSAILTYHIGYGGLLYEPLIELSGKPYAVKNYLEKSMASFSKVSKTGHAFGFGGSDRTLPFAGLEANVAKWNEISPVKMKISSLKEYYEAVRDTPDLPEYTGQVPNMWIVDGAYAKTFQDDQKALNLLATAEKLASISYILGYTKYPQDRIEQAWKGLILAHDHGYSGHGYDEGDKRKIVERQKAIYCAQDIIEESFTPIAEHVKADFKDCIPIVVFNPLSWERNEAVSAHFTLQIGQSQAGYNDTGIKHNGHRIETYPVKINDKMVLRDSLGKPVQMQILKKHDVLEYYILFRGEQIPALGYKTYYLYPSKEEYKEETSVRCGNDVLENEYLRLTVNEAGAFSLYDKKSGKVIINAARFAVIPDLGLVKEQKQLEDVREIPLRLDKTVIEENGPVRAALRLIFKPNHSCLRAMEFRVSLARGENKLDLEAVVDYEMLKIKEMPAVSLVVPFDIKDPKINYGIPYGSNESNNLMPESGIRRQPDGPGVPAHLWIKCRLIQKWIDVAGDGPGFTMASSRNFFILSKKDLRCELLHLNAPAFYDCEDIREGRVVSYFSIAPHTKSLQVDKAYRLGWQLNNPVITYSVNDTVSEKTLPETLSFVEPLSDNTVVTVLKKAEKGEGFILRAFEAEGKPGNVSVKFFRSLSGIQEVNLMEQENKNPGLSKDSIQPNEIKTYKVVLKSDILN